MSQSPHYNQSGQSQSSASRRNVYHESNTRHIFLEILLPCPDNLSGKAMFGSNQIKEQDETMKIQKEEVMLKIT